MRTSEASEPTAAAEWKPWRNHHPLFRPTQPLHSPMSASARPPAHPPPTGGQCGLTALPSVSDRAAPSICLPSDSSPPICAIHLRHLKSRRTCDSLSASPRPAVLAAERGNCDTALTSSRPRPPVQLGASCCFLHVSGFRIIRLPAVSNQLSESVAKLQDASLCSWALPARH